MADAEQLVARVMEDLARIEVSGTAAEQIAARIVERLVERGPEGYEELLLGVRLALTAPRAERDREDRAREELRRLERLMSGFATELRKLDESLEVLATFVRRMRADTGGDPGTTVH